MQLYIDIEPKIYEQDLDKINLVDMRWLVLINDLWKRDNSKCQLWECLSKDEKLYVIQNYKDEFEFQKRTLDGAHIIPRSKSKEHYYDLNNLVLVCRYFHSLLDTLKHPVTRDRITVDERLNWLEKARDFKRLN